MSCTSSTRQNIPQSIAEKIASHPCYDYNAHHHFARIHLPVAPACNIQCNYCNRKYDCSNESRPGVTSHKLSPEDAVKKLLFVGSKIQQLSVVGIAGPGDALANPKKTFETLDLVKQYAPDQKLCISTNGLMLPMFAEKLNTYNVEHITVTINTIDPKIGAQIYPWVYDTISKKRYKGEEGAALLLERQLEGIKKCVELGMLIKANTVLIPGVNQEGIEALSQKLKELGVFLHNIMPLLSEPEFGTYYGLNGVRSATKDEVKAAQEVCGIEMNLMTHCNQCRADAVGLLGEDRSAEFAEEEFAAHSFETLTKMYDITSRQATQEKILTFKNALASAQQRIEAEMEQISSDGKTMLIAATAGSEGIIDRHFGDSKEFLIYEVGDKGAIFRRNARVSRSYCDGEATCGVNTPIKEITKALKGVKILLTQKIGDCPKGELAQKGIIPLEMNEGKNVKAAVLEAYSMFSQIARYNEAEA